MSSVRVNHAEHNKKLSEKLYIIKCMEHPDNYAASCWEGIAQNDNTLINAPDLIGKIVDNYLQPKCVSDEDYTF